MLLRNKFFLALLAFALLIIAGAVPAIGNTNPQACAVCHNADVVAWKSSTHKKVPCQDCHQQKDALGFASGEFNLLSMTSLQVSGNYVKPVVAHVSNTPCLRCHSDLKKKISNRNGLRMEHASVINKGVLCTDCHNQIAHGQAVPLPKRITLDKCTSCHNGDDKRLADCGLCHEKREINPKNLGPWASLHGPDWKKAHGMGDLNSCGLCHDRNVKCAKCHQRMPHQDDWPFVHGTTAKAKGKGACTFCHQSSFCAGCHGLDMPHPNDWLKNHSKVAKGMGASINDATNSMKAQCYNCHLRDDCSRCHQRHIHPGGVVPAKTNQ